MPPKKTIEKKIYAMSVAAPNAGNEKKNIKDKVTKWVPFFKDSNNLYVNDLALRARRSPTHGAIIRSKRIYTMGVGWVFSKNDDVITLEQLPENEKLFIEKANNFQSLRDVFSNAALDYIMTGNAYIEVVKAVSGGQTAYNCYRIDATKVRINESKTECYVSSFWRDIKDNASFDSRFPIDVIELWDGNLDTNQQRYVMHLKQNEPEFDFYGIPEHHCVLKWADIEYKIPTFNLSDFDNGFFPSISLTLSGQVPDGLTPKEYVAKVVDSFSGEGKNGKIFAQLVDDPSQEMRVHEFKRDLTGSFSDLDRLAAQRIISGHRWFSSLSGIMIGGQLGNNQQIINEWKIAMNSLIIPEFQTPLLEMFQKLIDIQGFEFKIGIQNKPPVSIEDRINPSDVLTINEQRKELNLTPIEGGDVLINKSNFNEQKFKQNG